MSVHAGPLKDYSAQLEKTLPERGLIGQDDIERFVAAFTKVAERGARPKRESNRTVSPPPDFESIFKMRTAPKRRPQR